MLYLPVVPYLKRTNLTADNDSLAIEFLDIKQFKRTIPDEHLILLILNNELRSVIKLKGN